MVSPRSPGVKCRFALCESMVLVTKISSHFEATTADLDTSTSTANDTAENATTTQVSIAAPKSDVTSEEKRRLIREEKERGY